MHFCRIESYRFWQIASGPVLDSVGAHMPAFCWPGLTCTLYCAAAGLQTPKVVGTGVTTPRNKSGHASGVDLDDADREPGGIRRTKRHALTGALGGGRARECSSLALLQRTCPALGRRGCWALPRAPHSEASLSCP